MISDSVIAVDTDMPDALQSRLEKQGASTSTSSWSSNNTSKRRRISSLGIFDLPDIALVRISSYLYTPSRALLALSLTTSSKSWRKYKWNKKKITPILAWANVKRYEPSDQTKVIIASQKWEYLDFGELNNEGEKSICTRLKEDDLSGVLACINAKKNLKTLKIRGCVNIIGWGLQALSCSVVLRDIDLTQDITSNGKEDASFSEKLSEDVVLPILDNIINTADNSLTLVRFPSRWRVEGSPAMRSFLADYNRLLESRQVGCSKCTVGLWGNYLERDDIPVDTGWVNCDYGDHYDKWYGFQNFTCIKCTKFFCYECDNGVNGNRMLQTCKDCDEEYCHNCVPMKNCMDCSSPVCNDCSTKCPYSSSGCENEACGNCSDTSFMVCETCGEEGCGEEVCTGPRFHVCDSCCVKVQCADCYDEPGCLEFCDICDLDVCADCRYSKLSKDWGNACEGCIKLIAGELGKRIHKDKEEETEKILKDKKDQEYKYLALQREFDTFKLSQQPRKRITCHNGRNSLSLSR